MAVGPSQPHTMPQTAMTTTSMSRCLRLRVCRGSERGSKYDPMDSTFTNLAAMRGVLACGPGLTGRSVITPKVTPLAMVYRTASPRASPRILPIYARWPWDEIPRLKGRFLWKQYVEAKNAGATMLYQ